LRGYYVTNAEKISLSKKIRKNPPKSDLIRVLSPLIICFLFLPLPVAARQWEMLPVDCQTVRL